MEENVDCRDCKYFNKIKQSCLSTGRNESGVRGGVIDCINSGSCSFFKPNKNWINKINNKSRVVWLDI